MPVVLELFLRIFSDCCVIFALLGCCPTLLPYSCPLPAAALICAGAAGLSAFLAEKEKTALGRLCAVLPFLSVLLTGDPKELLILAVPVLYTAVIILRGGLYQEYFAYRKYFVNSLVTLAIIWALISVITYMEDPQDIAEDIIFTSTILQYALIHFLCGIVLQRQLRMGSRHTRGGAGQLAAVAGSVGVVTAGFFLTQPLFQERVIGILRKIGVVLFFPFAFLQEVWSAYLALILYLSEQYTKLMEKLRKKHPELQETVENSEGSAAGGAQDYSSVAEQVEELQKEPGHSTLVMVIAVVSVVVLLGLMFWAFTRRKEASGAPLVLSEIKEKEKKKRFSRLSNRGKVRQAYRDFLRQERSRGMKLHKRYTTQDILDRISDNTDRSAAAQLRDIYIAARYDDTREVTKAQTDAARAALRKREEKALFPSLQPEKGSASLPRFSPAGTKPGDEAAQAVYHPRHS